MHIIVEGPDGAGKTSLTSALRKKLPFYTWILRNNSRFKDWDEVDSILQWMNQFPTEQVLMLDRHPVISEAVYGTVLRGGSIMHGTPPSCIYQDYFVQCSDQPTFFIFCLPPTLSLLKGVKSEDQLEGVIPRIHSLRTEYVRLRESMAEDLITPDEICTYDYTNGGLKELITSITEWVGGLA